MAAIRCCGALVYNRRLVEPADASLVDPNATSPTLTFFGAWRLFFRENWMSYSDILKPRREVLSEEGVEGIIDLANVDDRRRRKLEARPADLFDLTYPTADTQRVVQTIHRRFSGDRDAPGLFLFEGLKGSGKSHLLVLVY